MDLVNYRNELGVKMAVYKNRYWTEIVAVDGGYTDMVSVFDHTAFSEKVAKRELRNALRRHARYVKSR